jgi:hypothetical protein
MDRKNAPKNGREIQGPNLLDDGQLRKREKALKRDI